jgi:hypothetical protein
MMKWFFNSNTTAARLVRTLAQIAISGAISVLVAWQTLGTKAAVLASGMGALITLLTALSGWIKPNGVSVPEDIKPEITD